MPLIAGLTTLAFVLGLAIHAPDVFSRAREAVFDALQRFDPWVVETPHVSVVDIDDESLRRVGQWPWSRRDLARLTRTLQDLGARSIAFDIVFAEPDRSSPSNLVEQWGGVFGRRDARGGESKLPDFDQEFVDALKRGRGVLGYGLLSRDNGSQAASVTSFATIGRSPSETVHNFLGAIPNLRVFEDAAEGNGSFSLTADHDQMVRALPLVMAYRGKLVSSLALEALRIAEDVGTIKIREERDGDVPVGYTVRIGDHDAHVALDGTILLHHGPEPAESAVPAWQLLMPETIGSSERQRVAIAVKDRIVLVGTSAVGLVDLRPTPFNPIEPGVFLHARAIEQILSDHVLRRPPWSVSAERMIAFVLALTAIGLASWARFSFVLTFLGTAAAVLVAMTILAFTLFGLLVDPVEVAIAVFSSGVASASARYLLVERDSARLRSAFSHYLAPSMVEALARHPERLTLGGELREMSFLFTDLEGFTAATERADPREIVAWLNTYLDGLCTIAMDHGGTIDKIVGDAVHVMFNAPLDQPDHAERAVRCAMAIDAFAEALRRRETLIDIGATRIGVNSGACVVGNFGGRRRFDYTAHGDAINTAARLEAANKSLGTRICVSRATVERIAGIDFVPVATLSLKGKTQGVDVFAPASETWAADYRALYARFASGDAIAAQNLVGLADAHPMDMVLALHARRIRAGLHTVALAA